MTQEQFDKASISQKRLGKLLEFSNKLDMPQNFKSFMDVIDDYEDLLPIGMKALDIRISLTKTVIDEIDKEQKKFATI